MSEIITYPHTRVGNNNANNVTSLTEPIIKVTKRSRIYFYAFTFIFCNILL